MEQLEHNYEIGIDEYQNKYDENGLSQFSI